MENHLQCFLKKHLIGGFSKNIFRENALKTLSMHHWAGLTMILGSISNFFNN